MRKADKKMSKKVISIVGRKGGVGKSTLSYNLASALATMDFKTLLIDLDSQNDSSLFLGISKQQYNKTFDDLFDKKNPTKLEECIIETGRNNLFLLPNNSLEIVDSYLHQTNRIDLIFKHILKDLDTINFDFVIVDSSPTKNRVNDALLCWTDSIVLPVQLQGASVRSVGNIYAYIADLFLDPSIIKAVVPNQFNATTNDSKENLKFLEEFFEGQNLLTPAIPQRTKIGEACKMGRTIWEYDQEVSSHYIKAIEAIVKAI